MQISFRSNIHMYRKKDRYINIIKQKIDIIKFEKKFGIYIYINIKEIENVYNRLL